MTSCRTPNITALAFAVSAALLSSAAQAQSLEDVVISASRSEQRSFDAPGSIQSVGRDVIESAGPQINMSEALAGVPGINVANRNNFSQDLQISIRGFGSRAPFGVRGVRLIIDGIPQTLPDGQGQSSQFALTSADRIEVLKGPIALLYGNAAGGVVQVFTRNASEKPELSVTGYTGSYDLFRTSTQYSDTRGPYGFVVDAATFRSNGFRDHSNAARDHLNAKLEYKGESGKTTWIANVLHNDTQEPGSLTLAQYKADRYQALLDNVSQKFGKDFTQGVLGVVSDRTIAPDQSISWRAYYGKRNLDNPLACPYFGANNCDGSVNLSNISRTGFSRIDRTFYGLGLSTTGKATAMEIPMRYTVGVDGDYMIDQRTAKQNLGGVPTGALGRDEDNIAHNTDLFAQSQWFLNAHYTGLLGARLTWITLKIEDHYLGDSRDGSGSRRYSGISPVVGLTRHLSTDLNIFAQYGRGFETPTLNEILYTPTDDKLGSTNQFYKLIDPARSQQIELGAKWRPSPRAKLDGSIFYARTKDDIAPLALNPSASTWQNIDTRRYGFEAAGLVLLSDSIALRGAFTWIQASYLEDFSTVSGTPAAAAPVAAGSRMPGIPRHRVFADLSWRSAGWVHKPSQSYSEAGIEFHAVSDIKANSQNTEQAGSYELFNIRASHEYRSGPQKIALLARIDNLLDKRYVGSVVVDQSSRRYYEPGMPRNWLLGAKYTLSF